jgi:hypothetical protein
MAVSNRGPTACLIRSSSRHCIPSPQRCSKKPGVSLRLCVRTNQHGQHRGTCVRQDSGNLEPFERGAGHAKSQRAQRMQRKGSVLELHWSSRGNHRRSPLTGVITSHSLLESEGCWHLKRMQPFQPKHTTPASRRSSASRPASFGLACVSSDVGVW